VTARDPLRLGYLVPEFPSQTHVFFWREIEALRALGVDVHLLSTRCPSRTACRHAFAAAARKETRYLFPPRARGVARVLLGRGAATGRALAYLRGLHARRFPRTVAYGPMLLSAADLAATAAERRLDHLHVHSCADAAHVAAMARLLGGPPYSITVHGDLPVYGGDHDAKMRGAAFVACVTRPLAEQVVRDARVPADRVPVIPMGIDPDDFAAPPARLARPGTLHVVTVARLIHAKGFGHVFAALRRLAQRGLECRYTIAGEGPDRADLEAAVARLGLADRVAFAGTVSAGDVIGLLERADAFVLASVGLGEAAPVAVMEAMAAGLPVVCSRIGGTPDMVTDGVDGILVEQRDDAAIATALERLARSPALRKALGAAARARALASFTSAATARALLAAIRGDARSAADGAWRALGARA